MSLGNYQEEGRDKNGQYFYDEYTNQIISHRISGSFHWEVPVINFKVGNSNF
jgi:hypothetical protein